MGVNQPVLFGYNSELYFPCPIWVYENVWLVMYACLVKLVVEFLSFGVHIVNLVFFTFSHELLFHVRSKF